MKSIILVVATVLCCSAFTIGHKRAEYRVSVNKTCEYNAVGIDSVYASWDGQMFIYRIKYCSQAFNADKRYVKFKIMLVDEKGNILTESATGPSISKQGALRGIHQAGVPVGINPYDCIISWSYKDVSNEKWEPTDDPRVNERSTVGDPEWKMISVNALKLFRFKEH